MSVKKNATYGAIALLLVAGAVVFYIVFSQSSYESLLSSAREAEESGELQEAYSLYQRALAHHSDSPDLLLAVSRVARRLGKMAEAESRVDEYLALRPDSPPGLVEKGRIAFEMQDFGKASDWFKIVLDREPSNGDALAGQGKALYELGRFRPLDQKLIPGPQDLAKKELLVTARASLERALQAGNSDANETRRYYVLCLLEVDEVGMALPLAQTLAQENPEDPLGQYMLAISLLADGQAPAALQTIEEAFELARNPSEEHGRGHRLAIIMDGYGRICYKLGKIEQAIDYFIKATRNDDQYLEGYLNAAALLSLLDRNREALNQLEEAGNAANRLQAQLGTGGESALNVYRRANEAQRLHDIEAALKHLGGVLEIEPDFTQGSYELACIDLRRGNEALAKNSLRELLRKAPDHLNSAYDLGALLLHEGLAEQAAECFKRIVDANPAAVDARLNLAEAYQRMGKPQQTNLEFDEALKVAPNAPEVLTRLGYSLELQGKPEEALKKYQEVVSRSPNSPEPRFRLALFYLKQGDGNRAVEEIEKALSANPGNERLTITLGDAVFATAQKANHADRPGRLLRAANEYNKVISLAQGVNLAAALTGKGNTEQAFSHPLEALNYYDQALEALGLSPDRLARALTLTNKAHSAYAAGKDAEALQAGLDAIKTISDLAQAQYNVGCIYAYKENWGGAQRYFQMATEADSLNHEGFYNLAVAYMNSKQTAQARRIFQENVESRRMQMPSQINLACIASQEGNWDEARGLLQKAAGPNGEGALVAANLAAVEFRNDRWKEAEDQARKALTLAEANPVPGDVEKRAQSLAYHVQGLLYARAERWQDAQGVLEKAIQISTLHSRESEVVLGHVYRAQGQFIAAEGIYLRVLKEHPNNIEVLNGLGDLYARSGDYENSRIMLRRSLSQVREQPQVRDALDRIETLWQET